MNIVDFLTELGKKFAPVDASTIKGVQIQLTDEYIQTIENYTKKMENNKNLNFEIEKLTSEYEHAVESNNPELGKDIARRVSDLSKGLQKASIIEKACNYLNKPYIKLILLLSFGIVSAMISKYILKKARGTKEVNEGLEDENNNNPNVYYNPYGYPTPPPYQYGPYGRGQQQTRY